MSALAPLRPVVCARDIADAPEAVIESFVAEGFVRLKLPAREVLDQARTRLLDHIRTKWLPDLERLDDYHEFVDDDGQHEEIQYNLSEFYWESDIHFRIIQDNLALLNVFFGRDLDCQKYPYLRIARPGKEQDNVGFHRDSHYGTSPFEISCFVPFTDLDEHSALRVIPESHRASEKAYEWVQITKPEIQKGSRKHKLGFPYAPKQLRPEVEQRTQAAPVRIGEILLFNTAMVHGQRLNNSRFTRFSSDIRLVNAFAPINRERNVHADYYRPLSSSAVTRQARLYEEANQASAASMTTD